MLVHGVGTRDSQDEEKDNITSLIEKRIITIYKLAHENEILVFKCSLIYKIMNFSMCNDFEMPFFLFDLIVRFHNLQY